MGNLSSVVSRRHTSNSCNEYTRHTVIYQEENYYQISYVKRTVLWVIACWESWQIPVTIPVDSRLQAPTKLSI